MSQSRNVALVLFPGALGDFLLFLPTLFALAERHEHILLAARSEWTALIDHPRIERWSMEHPAISALFRETPLAEDWRQRLEPVSRVYSWTGHGVAHFSTHFNAIPESAVQVYPFRAFAPGEHAVEYYARCAGVAPLEPARIRPHLCLEPPALHDVNYCQQGLLVVHPGSGARNKNWSGFPRLVARWKQLTGGPVAAILGPAELERGTPQLEVDFCLARRPLPEVAGLLAAAPRYVGNDSGVSHLAALLDTPAVVLLGPHSSPAHWKPRSERSVVVTASAPCARCGPEVFCEHLVSSDFVLRLLQPESPCPRLQ